MTAPSPSTWPESLFDTNQIFSEYILRPGNTTENLGNKTIGREICFMQWKNSEVGFVFFLAGGLDYILRNLPHFDPGWSHQDLLEVLDCKIWP